MHYYHFRAIRFLWLPVLLFSFLASHGRLFSAEEHKCPNIVWMISDDQAYSDYGFMGNHAVQTPHLDRLAEQGARFPNGYLPESVCRPTLASIVTGLHPHQTGITFNHPPQKIGEGRHAADYLIRQVPTIPRMLKSVGYVSFQTGKWWEGHYHNGGFDEGMTLGAQHWIERDFGLREAHGNGDAGLMIGRRTMEPIGLFLDRHGDKPFFLWYAPFLPHTPHNAARKYLDLYEDNPRLPLHMKRYYANITWFDETVGQLVAMLEDRDLVSNTLFVFVADNGFVPRKNPPPGYTNRSKKSPYEYGVRTPILLSWEGHIVPATYTELVSALDIVPTTLAAAGVESEKKLPGISLLPAAKGQAELPKRPMFGATYRHQCKRFEHPEEEVVTRWVRLDNLKLIEPVSAPNKPMLFNVVEDPHERINLAGRDDYAEAVAKRQRLLDEWWNPVQPE